MRYFLHCPAARRRGARLLLLLALLLPAACGGATTAVPQGVSAITLADLPPGFGRGYLEAVIDAGAATTAAFAPGDPAPDFTLLLDDGRYVRLSDLQGQPVVLNFWATWCPPCRAEMPELVKAANAGEDVIVLAVAVKEDRTTVKNFAVEYKLNLPVALDRQGKLSDLYRVQGFPTTYFIDRDGNFTARVVGQMTPDVLAQQLAAVR
jgi:peroxiredoxin